MSTRPTETVCPGGPLLVRGLGREVTAPDGSVHPTTRAVSAVCRCDRSSQQPWCDGTHKVLPAHLLPD